MKKSIKIILFVVLIFVSIFLYKTFFGSITAQSIRDYISSYGILAPIIYIAIWVFLPIFFFPVPILALAGGLSFGLIDGTIYTLIGAMLNSSVMFFIANYFAKDTVREYLERKLPKNMWQIFEGEDSKKGFIVVLICRLIPIMPYNVINYVSGLTNIDFKKYSLATFLGILPGTVIFLNVGDKIIDINSKDFIISIVLVVLLTVVSLLMARRVNKTDKRV